MAVRGTLPERPALPAPKLSEVLLPLAPPAFAPPPLPKELQGVPSNLFSPWSIQWLSWAHGELGIFALIVQKIEAIFERIERPPTKAELLSIKDKRVTVSDLTELTQATLDVEVEIMLREAGMDFLKRPGEEALNERRLKNRIFVLCERLCVPYPEGEETEEFLNDLQKRMIVFYHVFSAIGKDHPSLDIPADLVAMREWVTNPGNVEVLAQVTNLNLRANNIGKQLTDLPRELAYFTNLTSLNLWGHDFKTIPERLSELREIQHLDMSGCNLTTLESLAERCPQLEELHVDNNALTTIPDEIGLLPSLRVFTCANNRLMGILRNFSVAPSLEYLDYSGNLITTIPSKLAHNPSLQHLELDEESVRSLDEEGTGTIQLFRETFVVQKRIFLALLKAAKNSRQPFPLEELASDKDIACFMNSEEIEEFRKLLTDLDLSNLGFAFIPDPFLNFPKLQSLNISRNQLSKVPEAVFQLQHLTRLDVSHNQIAEGLSAARERMGTGVHIKIFPNPCAEEAFQSLIRDMLSMDSFGSVDEMLSNFERWMNDASVAEDLAELTRLDLSNLQLFCLPKKLLMYCVRP